MKEKLQILEKQIRKDLPRLLEPTIGCWFENSLEDGLEQLVFIEEVGIGKLYYHLSYNNKIYKVKEIDDRYKVIGHDILLSDVLEWLEETRPNSNLTTELNRVSSIREGYSMTLFIQFDDLDCDWYLSKPYLKDQSEELIEFLYNLTDEEDEIH